MTPLSNILRANEQAGLSLVELLISLALGLVLTLGVTQIFLGSSKTYRLTDGLALLQENMRFAQGNLQYDSRMAGHYGCLIPVPENLLNTASSEYSDNVYDVGEVSAMGWEATGTGLGDSFTITSLSASGTAWSNGTSDSLPSNIAGEIIPGTDVLMINGGTRLDDVLSGNPSTDQISTDANTTVNAGVIILVVSSDCSGGALFQKMNAKGEKNFEKNGSGPEPGNLNPAVPFEVSYDDDASVYEFNSVAYYIGEGAGGEPALFRYRLDAGNQFGAVELIEGVENMQILYGVANSSLTRRAADSYETAENVTDWAAVVSVRIALLMRTDDNLVDTAAAKTYNLTGAQITTQSDRRARLVGVSTVGIRNRLE